MIEVRGTRKIYGDYTLAEASKRFSHFSGINLMLTLFFNQPLNRTRPNRTRSSRLDPARRPKDAP